MTQATTVQKPGAVAWAKGGFGFGAVVSIAGNLADACLPAAAVVAAARAAGQPIPWQANPVAIVFAVLIPVALMVTVESMTRVTWPSGWQWALARYGGVGFLALLTAIMSYLHMAHLLGLTTDSNWFTIKFGPLVPDGLMLVTGFALLGIAHLAQADGSGRCRHCGRDPGVGHEPDCPAWRPPATAVPVCIQPARVRAEVVPDRQPELVPDPDPQPELQQVPARQIGADPEPDPPAEQQPPATEQFDQQWISAGLSAIARLNGRKDRINRDTFAKELRAMNRPINTTRASALLRHLQTTTGRQ